MISHYIERELISHGFTKEKKNTGYYYNKTVENIELICFIEIDIKFYFITVYHWNNNRVRGVYPISSVELKESPEFISVLFKNTLRYIPRFIGNEIDTHKKIRDAIDEVFVY